MRTTFRPYLTCHLKRGLLALAFATGLLACSPSEPIRLGFIAGTSGRVADLGVSGRNGTILAVEQQNARGGIDGRQIQLLLRDDQQEPEMARQGVRELLDAGVAAIIGPMTSTMAAHGVPLANDAGVLMMGGTVTTNDLTGKDDMFLRTLSPTRDHALMMAEYLYRERGLRQLVATLDQKNKTYTESWLGDFETAFTRLGGRVLGRVPFESSEILDIAAIARQLAAMKAEGALIVSNSVDAALIIKELRQQAPQLVLATAEWAGTERLVELGGVHADGVIVLQYLDRDSNDPAYREFHRQFVQRFNQEPGYAGMIAYNATNVVLKALAAQQEDQSLRDTILSIRRFQVLQGDIEFDQYGDVRSRTYITEIRNGTFRLVH